MDTQWVQLATRIPKDLHRQLKLLCVEEEITLMSVVTEALRERVAKKGRKKAA